LEKRDAKELGFRSLEDDPYAVWWTTWTERNQGIFEGKEMSCQDFKLYFSNIEGVKYSMVVQI